MLKRLAYARKMMKVALLFSLTAVVSIGCGDEKKKTVGDVTELEGTWLMASYQSYGASTAATSDDEYTSVTKTFKGSVYTQTEKIAVGSTVNYSYQYDLTASFKIGDEVSAPAGAKKIDITGTAATLTLLTDTAVAEANNAADPLYGYTDWVKGVAKNIADKKQSISSTSADVSLQKVYTIYKICGKRLLRGAEDSTHDGSSDALRPVVLGETAFVRDSGIAWTGLTGDVYPENNTPSMTAASANYLATSAAVTLANGYFTLNSPTVNLKEYWSYDDINKANGSKYITLVFRTRGTAAATTNSIINFEISLGDAVSDASGPKVRLALHNSGNLQFETADGTDGHTFAAKISDVVSWHVYQLQMEVASDNKSVTARVFLDGSDTPLYFTSTFGTATYAPILTNTVKANMIAIGDISLNNACSCDLDYAVWSTDGNFYPSEIKGTISSKY